MKHCYRCNTDKPLSEFYNNKSRKDGRASMCKMCDKQRIKETYRNITKKQRRIPYKEKRISDTGKVWYPKKSDL